MGNRPSGIVWVGIALAAAMVVMGLSKWANDDDDDRVAPERNITVENVTEADAFDDDGFAKSLVGQQVTVSADVSEMVSSDAIRIGGDDLDADGLLVIGVSNANLSKGDDVRVTGTVREFDAATFERTSAGTPTTRTSTTGGGTRPSWSRRACLRSTAETDQRADSPSAVTIEGGESR